MDNLKKYNKNAKPNKDIFLYLKFYIKQQDIILMLRFFYISTNLRSHLSGTKLLYSKLTEMIKLVKSFNSLDAFKLLFNFSIFSLIKRASLMNKIFQSIAESNILVLLVTELILNSALSNELLLKQSRFSI